MILTEMKTEKAPAGFDTILFTFTYPGTNGTLSTGKLNVGRAHAQKQ